MKISPFLPFLILLALACSATGQVPEMWESTFSEAAAPSEATGAWTPTPVPEFIRSSRPEPLWYRCEVTIPEVSAGERMFLRFGGVRFSTEVWLDGQRLGKYVGGFEPFEFEITPHADGGAHTLHVRVVGIQAVCKTPIDWEGLKQPGMRVADLMSDALLHPVGSAPTSIGIWEPVTLVRRGAVSVSDLFLQTSVRRGELRTDGELRNWTDAVREVVVRFSVEGPNAPALPEQRVTLPAGGCGAFSCTHPWPDAALWQPGSPTLYAMTVTVCDPAGNVLATHRDRFGFREFWCDGPDFYLNGTKIHLLATASHPRGDLAGNGPMSREGAVKFFERVRAANCNAVRLHANLWPLHWFQVADEMGMPVVIETPFFCYSRSYALTDPEFWRNMEAHLTSLVKTHRNHPSIIITSICNEILHCGGAYCEPECESRLARLGLAAKKLDPTRPIMFDGDMDPKLHPEDATGVADIVNPHYPIDFAAVHAGKDTNLPLDFWWIDRGKEMACYPGEFWRWDRKKPLYFGEFLHLQHFTDPDPYALLLGGLAFDLDFEDAMAECKARAWRMQIHAYRAAGVSGMCPWTLTEPGPEPEVKGRPNPRFDAVRESYRPVGYFIRPIPRRVVPEGMSQTLTIDFFNDTPKQETVVFRALFRGARHPDVPKADVREAALADWTITLPPAGHVVRTLDVPAGEFESPTELATTLLRAEDSADSGNSADPGDSADSDDFEPQTQTLVLDACVYPGVKKLQWPEELKTLEVGVLADSDSPALAALRRQFPDVRVLGDLSGTLPRDVLIIGKNRLAGLFPKREIPTVADSSGVAERLRAFLEAGGKMLVLEQEAYPEGVFPVQLSDLDISCDPHLEFERLWASAAQYSVSHCPPYQPKQRSEAAFYRTIHRPFLRGEFALDVFGGPKGMAYSSTCAFPVGKSGLVILTQLPLETDWEVDLYARSQFLDHLRALTDSWNHGVLGIIDPTGTMIPVLRQTGCQFEDITTTYERPDFDRGRFQTVWIHADTPVTAALREWMRSHAPTLHANHWPECSFLLHKLTPETLPGWTFGEGGLPAGMVLRRNRAPIHGKMSFLGLENFSHDLHWSRPRTGLASRAKTQLAEDVAPWVFSEYLPEFWNTPAIKTVTAREMGEFPNPEKIHYREDHFFCGVATSCACTFPEAKPGAEYFLRLDAHGAPLAGVGSILEILVDGQSQGTVELPNDWGQTWFPVRFPAEVALIGPEARQRKVTLRFINDLWDPETREDRGFWFRSVELVPARAIAGLTAHTSPAATLSCHNLYIDQVNWTEPEFPATSRRMLYLYDILSWFNLQRTTPLGALTLTGDRFTPGKEQYTVRGTTLFMGSNGSSFQSVHFGKSGSFRFELSGRGTGVDGVYPLVELLLDGQRVGEFRFPNDLPQTLTLTADVAEGTHRVELRFTNDLWNPETLEDRNVHLDSLRILAQ